MVYLGIVASYQQFELQTFEHRHKAALHNRQRLLQSKYYTVAAYRGSSGFACMWHVYVARFNMGFMRLASRLRFSGGWRHLMLACSVA